jgi:glycosyltransferase involved in cell wall biosynthesis
MQTSLSSDYFFSNSMATRNDYKRLFPIVSDDNSSVIYLAADSMFTPKNEISELERIKKKYNLPQNKKYVFSLCTLEPRKNLLRAVKCFLIFLEKNKIDDLVWVMGGSAWVTFIETLKKECATWNPDVIIRAGYVDDDDLPVLYGNAEWFVYTSQYEGFGLPPLEAMQCGCPVITSNNSSLPEVVGDAGIMIDWDSDEQHVEAYEKYYFNEELRNDFGHRAQARAKMFSWEKTVDKIVDVMKERN